MPVGKGAWLMSSSAKRIVTGSALVGALLVLAVPATASAMTASAVARSTCTQGSNAMLTLSHDDGHVEGEIELHTGKAGQPWTVRLYSDGVREWTVTRSTSSEDGGGTLSVSRLLTHHAGVDAIKATAVNKMTGERCVVRATL
ncbi:unannotated protein [freshwater metagenome]|uniref:Unannotated protein n=1 Tax=freshwater metagenome TaxID=449393 RepID=A0A6J7LML9_9ZZZZ